MADTSSCIVAAFPFLLLLGKEVRSAQVYFGDKTARLLPSKPFGRNQATPMEQTDPSQKVSVQT